MSGILIVEDETKLAAALAQGLRRDGFDVSVVHNGEAGLEKLRSEFFGLILLDLTLPGISGLDTLRRIRNQGLQTPVLILTAMSTVDDRVEGLNAGADDYLVKPFALRELMARVRALLRSSPEETRPFQVADLTIDRNARCVVRAGVPIDVTAREYQVVEYLLAHQGAVVTRELLARDIWKVPARCTTVDNVVDAHIARIRKKLDGPFQTKLLHTIRGLGFTLRAQEVA